MKVFRTVSLLTVLSAFALISACGGGGSGGPSSVAKIPDGMHPPTTEPPTTEPPTTEPPTTEPPTTEPPTTEPPTTEPPMMPTFTGLHGAASSIPRLGRRSVTQSSNTDENNVTTDNAAAVFDRGHMALTVTRSDGTQFTLDSTADAISTALSQAVRNEQIAREWQLEKQFSDNTAKVQGFGEIPDNIFPLRAIRAAGNYGTNQLIVEAWEDSGRSAPLVPHDFIAWLKSLHVNLVGLSIALRYDDSMDSTLERVYSGTNSINTFTDDAIRQFIREFKEHGIDSYLTLALQSEANEVGIRPAHRWQLGDPGHPDTGVPPEDPSVFGRILPENWPWRPDHPDHERFVAEFWRTHTENAVHFARIAEEEGVRIFSLGTETERLFRTRSGGYWPNHFRQELQTMVSAVREVYSGHLTYDMHYTGLTAADHFGLGSNHLWEDLDLDFVGVSAYFELADSPPTTATSVESFEKRYDEIFQKFLVPLAERNPDRPIVFLEYGAVDTVESPADPGGTDFSLFEFQDTDGNGLDDGRETQANMYQALVNTMAKYPGLVNGVLWTENWVTSGELWAEYWGKRRGFSVYDKLSEDVVRAAHESWGEWMTGGHWMLVNGDMDVIESGAFVDGPELSGSPTIPSQGTATYEGIATGGYATTFGTDYADVTQGSHAVGEYKGQLQMTADFQTGLIGGKVHSIYVNGVHMPHGGASIPVTNNAFPYELNLKAASFSNEGFTGITTVTSTDPGIGVASSSGAWGGKFSVKPDGDGNPRLVAGTHGETFVTTGGTQADLIGAYVGVTKR